MKKSCENNIEKEKCFKKILNNKSGLFLFIFFSSILVDTFIVFCFPKILKSDCFKSLNINFVWIGFLIYSILSFVFLKYIRKIKNKYSKSKSITRFLLDFIFILKLYFLVSIVILLFLVKNCNDLSLENIKILKEFNLTLVYLITEFYILNYIIKYVMNKSWKFITKMLLGGLIFITFLGIIDLNNLGLLTLICTIMSQFMSYDNIKYLYGKISKVDYSTINEEKTKEQISFVKVIINFIIILLYFYIVLTEVVLTEGILQCIWDNTLKYIFENIFNYSKIPSFFWKGITRFGILYILLVIVVICKIIWLLIKIAFYSIKIFWYSIIFKNDKKKLEYSEKKKKEYEKKHFQFDLILKKYLKKNIIRVKRHIEMNKSKINKTNIKTSIHINSQKKSHRLYKYKNIEFHNKKPNSN
jgi:membrane protein